jgi:hypothetical protein
MSNGKRPGQVPRRGLSQAAHAMALPPGLPQVPPPCQNNHDRNSGLTEIYLRFGQPASALPREESRAASTVFRWDGVAEHCICLARQATSRDRSLNRHKHAPLNRHRNPPLNRHKTRPAQPTQTRPAQLTPSGDGWGAQVLPRPLRHRARRAPHDGPLGAADRPPHAGECPGVMPE